MIVTSICQALPGAPQRRYLRWSARARVYCCVQTHTLGPQSPGVAGFKNVKVVGAPAVAV